MLAWIMFAADVIVPVTATFIISKRSRVLAEASQASHAMGRPRTTGTNKDIGDLVDPLVPRRAGNATSLWLIRCDLVGISGVAFLCLILLRSRPSDVVLVESVLFGCCLVSLVLNALFSRSSAKWAAENAKEESLANRSRRHGS